jgi:hypothetical protein
MTDAEKREARNRRDRERRASQGGTSRAPRAPSRRTARSLYPEITAALTMTNTILSLSPLGSKYEPTGQISTVDLGNGMQIPMPELRMIKLGDELDDAEIMQLASAIDRQCQRSPRFKRYVELALNGISGGGILGIMAMIGARRAARHGVIDPSYDARLGAMMAGDLSSLAAFTPSPDANATVPETGEQPPRRDDPGDNFDSM